MSASQHIAIVDDEEQIRAAVGEYLELHGFRVSLADGGAALRRIMADAPPVDLVVLDLNMPGEDGLTIARYLREHSEVGIVILTAAGQTLDRIVGLEVGADDYMVKPFSVGELMARIRNQLRRTRPAALGGRLVYEDIVLDAETHKVLRDGAPVPLGPTEFRLLSTLMEKPGRVWSREQLLDRVWGRDIFVDTRTVDVHIGRLRKSLCQHGGPDPLRTVRGAGYALG